MYPAHFGLKGPAFSITPDPRYLFLSQQHHEALAHLLYGAQEGGGFVLLTGEVGTGKTTICRTFLEQVPEDVDVVLVLNPALTAPELLRTVCDEFGIQVPENESSVKVLSDYVNDYLLKAHAGGRRPVLMIDEAQNLALEVLEQIRLLTNLETRTDKLLQVFLVGQPELRESLKSQGLRQLAQRITARYHLLPLSARETGNYIRHRLGVAGAERPLFTEGAIRTVYRLTNGIPRLINILCDRALLGAFATDRSVVDRKIVTKASYEIRGERPPPGLLLPILTVSVFLFLISVIGLLVYERTVREPASPAPEVTRAEPPQAETTAQPAPAEPEPAAMAEPAPLNVGTKPAAAAAATPDPAPVALPAPDPDTAPDDELFMEPDLPPGTGPAATAVATAVEEVSSAMTETVPEEPVPEAVTEEVEQPVVEQPAKTPAQEITPAGTDQMVSSFAATKSPVSEPSLPVPDKRPEPEVDEPRTPPTLDEILAGRTAILSRLLQYWNLEYPGSDFEDPCLFAKMEGLLCREERGRWEHLRRINRPALIRLVDPSGQQGFVLLKGLGREQALLDLGDGKTMHVPLTQLETRWSARFEILWRPPPGGDTLIGQQSPDNYIHWLRQQLFQVPDYDAGDLDSGAFDAALRAEVLRFQRQQGLIQDGLVGPRTMIALNSAATLPDIPRLEKLP